MTWKGLDFFPHDLKFPFTRYMWLAVIGSLALNFLALGLAFTKGINFSIDFTGGTLMEIKSKTGPMELGSLRAKLEALGVGTPQVQAIGDGTSVLVRLPRHAGGDAEQQAAVKAVQTALGTDVTYERTDSVGPTVSGEITQTALIAVLVSLFAIAAYVWFRFEWQFALGAGFALIHDVLMTVGLFSLTGLEFDNNCIAALLTIVGYSINDTVVVSDRIRENLRKYKKMPLNNLIDASINETLSRTVLTAGTVIIALLALLFFGGEVIRSFVIAMLFGIVTGTYSSIFIASPVLLLFGVKRDWSGTAKGTADGQKASAATGKA
jgi:preprotein translocase subunit SecF